MVDRTSKEKTIVQIRIPCLLLSLVIVVLAGGCNSDGNVGNNLDADPEAGSPMDGGPLDVAPADLEESDAQKTQGWVIPVGGDGNDVVLNVLVDGDGNLILQGAHEGTMKLDGVQGEIILTSPSGVAWSNTFIAKLDPTTRKFLWAVPIDGMPSGDINLRAHGERSGFNSDAQGNIYYCSKFKDSATLDDTTLISSGEEDIFVTKLDPDGKIEWAVRAGGPGTDDCSALAVNSDGTITIGGMFSDTAEFGSFSRTAAGKNDLFVARLESSNGSFEWVFPAGSDSMEINEYAVAIASDDSGNSFITGEAGGGATFGSTTMSGSPGKLSAYIAKIDPAGTFVWLAELQASYSQHITLDTSGNIYVLGGIGLDSSSPNIFTDNIIMIAKGRDAFSWNLWTSPAICNGGLHPNHLIVDEKGNIIISGAFKGRIQFSATTLTSGTSDPMAYLARLDPDGNFTGAQSIVAPVSVAAGLARDKTGGLYVVGRFTGTADFGGIELTSEDLSGGGSSSDGYVWYTRGLE